MTIRKASIAKAMLTVRPMAPMNSVALMAVQAPISSSHHLGPSLVNFPYLAAW
jgi:hypothetical protein